MTSPLDDLKERQRKAPRINTAQYYMDLIGDAIEMLEAYRKGWILWDKASNSSNIEESIDREALEILNSKEG